MKVDDEAAIEKILAARSWFENWHQTSKFEEKYWECRKLITPRLQFTRRETKWLLEAYLLIKFAKLKSLEAIRLNHDDPPDAYFADQNKLIPLEITEVLEPGRQRGSEYPDDESRIENDPVEEWIRRADSIPGALSEGLNKKKRKKYPNQTELLVYLNIGEWGIRQSAIQSFIRHSLSQNTEPFSKIHVLWKANLFSSDGEMRSDANIIEDEFDDDAALFREVTEGLHGED